MLISKVCRILGREAWSNSSRSLLRTAGNDQVGGNIKFEDAFYQVRLLSPLYERGKQKSSEIHIWIPWYHDSYLNTMISPNILFEYHDFPQTYLNWGISKKKIYICIIRFLFRHFFMCFVHVWNVIYIYEYCYCNPFNHSLSNVGIQKLDYYNIKFLKI